MATTPDISSLSSNELQRLIEAAQEQIKTKRFSELTNFTDAYLHKVQAAGFTVKDAIGEIRKFESARTGATPEKKSLKAKYRGPNGELWTGQGQLPKWMRARIEAGQAKSKEDFRITD